MKQLKRLMILCMMSLVLVSCSDEQDTLEELQEKEEAGKQELIKISRFERNMVYFRYSKGFTTFKNGVSTTEYTMSAKNQIKTKANARTARTELRSYRNMVGSFLSNYPKDKFIISNREELKTKRSLAYTMLTKVNNLKFKSDLDNKGNLDLNELNDIEKAMKHIGFKRTGSQIKVDLKSDFKTSFEITEAIDEVQLFLDAAELFVDNYPTNLYIYDSEVITIKIGLAKKVLELLTKI